MTLKRIHSDKSVNKYVYKLLDFCKSSSLYISLPFNSKQLMNTLRIAQINHDCGISSKTELFKSNIDLEEIYSRNEAILQCISYSCVSQEDIYIYFFLGINERYKKTV